MTCTIRALLVSLICFTTARAANYIVVTNSDSGLGSLRQAVLDANASGGGTISLSNITGIIGLQTALPTLTANITISGPGASQVGIICSNCDGFAVLTNSATNSATLSGLTVRADLDNYGTFVLLDSILVGEFNLFHSALYNSGTMTLSRCTFTGNQVFSGSAESIQNDGTMNLDNCSITNNTGDGASVVNTGNLTMDNSVVSGHKFFTSGLGGIDNAGGIMVLRNCTISDNWSLFGGGIWNGGYLAVTNCLISSNLCDYPETSTPGGGLYNIGYAVLENTTVSGNRAGGPGGGICNRGALRLLSCTISSNFVQGDPRDRTVSGGGVWNLDLVFDSAVIQSRNTIIAGNHSSNTNCSFCPDDFNGYFGSFGHNLIQNTNGWKGAGYNKTDLFGVDPMLGPLRDNGGPTWTHALLPGSPAIDAGDPAGAPADDERGVPRPEGFGVDIGAFEYQYLIPVFARFEVQSRTNLFLEAFGFPSTSYTLQASQDFISWDTIATLTTASNGVLQFTGSVDPIARPKRFYRLQFQTP